MAKKKSTVKQIRTIQHTEEWYQFRYDHGFGGSEIASVLASKSAALNQLVYTPPIKLHLLKIGEPVQEFTGNVASESGHFFEPIILDWYKFSDLDNFDQVQMFRNIKDNIRINKVIRPKVFMVNSKYPWLFYSPDGFGWKNMKGKKRLMESKNTTSMEANRYENKVSPAFYAQVQQGLLVTELECADLCILIDGRWLEIVTIYPDPPVQEQIIETSKEMWDKILAARQIKQEYGLPAYFGVNPDSLSVRQLEGAQLLEQLEPEIIGTQDEWDLYREMVIPKEEDDVIELTPEMEDLAIKYLAITPRKEELEIERKKLYIELIKALQGKNIARRENDTNGPYYSYKANKKGVRNIYVSPKFNP